MKRIPKNSRFIRTDSGYGVQEKGTHIVPRFALFAKVTSAVRRYGSVSHALVPGRMCVQTDVKSLIKDVRSHGSVSHALVPGRTSVMSIILSVFVLAISIAQPFSIQPTHAAINEQLNFQARLLNDAGGLVPDGYYNIEFKIVCGGDGLVDVTNAADCAHGTNERDLWTETWYDSNGVTAGNDNRVRVVNGYISVQLGSLTPFGSSIDWNESELYLSINIGGSTQTATPTWDGEMDPHMRLTAVPYAFNAANLEGRGADEFVQLDPGATPQAVSTANSAVAINQTGAGNVLQLQAGGTDVLVINNSGNATFSNDLAVEGNTTIGNASSDTLTVNAAATLNTTLTVTLADTENVVITTTATGTSAVDLVSTVLTNNTASGTQRVALLQNAAGSGDTESILAIDNADTDTAVVDGLIVTSAAGTITDGLDVSDTDIVNAINVGDNVIIGTTATIDFTNFDVDGTGNVTAGGTLDVAGATTLDGNVTLGDSNADTITLWGESGAANGDIIFGHSSFQSCSALETDASGILTCGTAGASTLQGAYEGGNTIVATDAEGDIDLTVSEATNFSVDITGTGNFLVQDSGTAVLTVNSSGNVGVGTNQFFFDRSNNVLAFGNDTYTSANIELYTTGQARFNMQNANVDFQIGGQSLDNLFYVDASANAIGIGDSTPDTELDIDRTGRAALTLDADNNGDNIAQTSYIQLSKSALTHVANLGLVGVAGQSPSGAAYSNTIVNSLLLSTSTATPIAFGTNNVVRADIESGGAFNVYQGDFATSIATTTGNSAFNVQSNAGTGPIMTLYKQDGTLTSGEDIGAIRFGNNDAGAAGSNYIFGGIKAVAGQDITAAGDSDIIIFTQESTERLRVGYNGTSTFTGPSSGANTTLVVNNSASTGTILDIQDNGSSVFTVADGGAVTAASTLAVQGASVTVGSSSTTNGTLVLLNSTNAFGVTISAEDQTVGSAVFTFPDSAGVSDTICLLTLANCVTGTLQNAYNNDADGSDATIALTSADDSLIISNPSSGGTDSAFVLRVEQLNSGTAQSVLVIDNVGTGESFRVNDSGTGDTTPFVIDASGNVGIGAASPSTLLDISSTTGPVISVRRDDTTVTAGTDALGAIDFYTNDTNVTTNTIAAKIQVATTSVATGYSSNFAPADINFQIQDTSGALNTYFGVTGQDAQGPGVRIYQNSTVYSTLSLSDAAALNDDLQLKVQNTVAGSNAAFVFSDEGYFGINGDNNNIVPTASLSIIQNGSADYIRLSTTTAGTGDVFTVANNGRVGIGVAAPTYDLSFGEGANRTVQVEARASNAAGRDLTVKAGAAGTGASAFSGGALYLQGGDAAGTGNANGGNVHLSGGSGVGTGVDGLVVIDTPTYSTVSNVSCAVNCTITQANVDSYSAIIVNSTASGVDITVPDPTNLTAGRTIYVTAADTSEDFTLVLNGGGTLIEIAMRENVTATLIWNGADWTAAGASSSTTLQAAYDNTLTSAGGAEIVLNATGGAADGLTVRNNATSPIIGGIFEAQTSIGSNLFSVNNNADEYASNGGAETEGASASTFPASTWAATPTGGTVTRYTTQDGYVATGIGSVSVVTGAAASEGTANTLASALTPNLSYTVSYAVRGTSSFSTLDTVYSPDGTNTGTVDCATAQTVTQGLWTRIICTFDAPASGITSSNAIFIRQSDATARTFYIENLSVTIKADVNHAADGSVDDAGGFGTYWTAAPGGGTVTRDTAIIYDTSASVKVETTATIGHGITNNMSITPTVDTQYLVTFYARSSNTFNDIRVRYSRDGGSNFVSCTDYNTQSVSTASWTRITCLFTTDGTTPTDSDLIIDQPTATARDFYVDALEITLNENTASNVQIGGGNLGGPVTLFTLDRSAGAPVAANNDAYLGSMYFDTVTGRIQCYEAGGWGTCGAPPDNIVNLNPEYAGSVLNGTGVGTMTADVCANGGGLSIGTSLCASGETRNYYQWTSPQATDQTYSIYVTYQLPSTFDGFDSDDTIQLTARVDNTTNANVTYEVFRSQGGAITQCYSGATETDVTSTVDTWQTVGINGNEATGCGFTRDSANAFVLFKINLTAKNNANAYVSTLSFTTTGR